MGSGAIDPLTALTIAATALANLGFALIVGSLATIALLRRSGAETDWSTPRIASCARLCRGSIAGSLIAVLVQFVGQAATIADVALGDVGSVAASVVVQTHVGRASLVVFGALAASAVTARQLLDSRRPVAIWTCVAFALVARASAGHAGARDGTVPIGVDALHLLATFSWVGSVAVGALLIARAASTDSGYLQYAKLLSTLATSALAGVVLTGAYNSWLGLHGSAGAIAATTYGHVWAVKVALVILAVALGGFNRFVGLPRLQRAGTFAGVLRIEALVLALVVVVAALLSATPPVGD